jgi:hypothetical protein
MSGLLRNKFEKHFAFQAVTAPAGIAAQFFVVLFQQLLSDLVHVSTVKD